MIIKYLYFHFTAKSNLFITAIFKDRNSQQRQIYTGLINLNKKPSSRITEGCYKFL